MYRDQFWRYQSHFGGTVLQDWATVPEVYGVGTQYLLPIKYTATLTNKLLLEAGWSHWGYDNTIFLPQPGWRKPHGSPEWYANAARRDLVTGYLTVAGGNECCYRYLQPADVYQAAVSYVTGSHQLKAGFSHKRGYRRSSPQENNGALEQQYRTGVPNSVSVAAHPSDAQSRVNHDAGHLRPGSLDGQAPDGERGRTLRDLRGRRRRDLVSGRAVHPGAQHGRTAGRGRRSRTGRRASTWCTTSSATRRPR